MGPMREVMQWSIEPGTWLLRHDVRYIDPASGALVGFFVETRIDEGDLLEEPRMRFLRETVRVCFTRLINRKCGVDAMINRTLDMCLPITATHAKFV